MSFFRSMIWGDEEVREAAREKGHLATARQIEEAKAAVAEVGVLKDALVAKANGSLYELRNRTGVLNGTGESKAELRIRPPGRGGKPPLV